jgi:hypothetical protein
MTQPPSQNMPLKNEMIDKRGAKVAKENGEHHPLGECRIDDADENAHGADQ